MRIVIDIKDDMVVRWGGIYIHNPQYDASKVAVFLPGFEYNTPEEGNAVQVNILSTPIVAGQAKQPTPKPAENVKDKGKAEQNKPAETVGEKEPVEKDGEQSKEKPGPAPAIATPADEGDKEVAPDKKDDDKKEDDDKKSKP